MGEKKRGGTHIRYGVQRPFQSRHPLPIVVVACDDTKTAVAYFNELKREVKQNVTVEVLKAPCGGASAHDVCLLATERATELSTDDVHNPGASGDSVWALIDRESEPAKQKNADLAKRNTKAANLTVILSNPCFEVWTLAHFVDTGEQFINCNAVLDRIKIEWRKAFRTDFGPKAQADYQKLTPYRNEAVRRAKKNRRAKTNQSWTEVYMVVEVIISRL